MTFVITLLLVPFTLLTTCFAIELFTGLRALPQPRRGNAGSWRAVVVVPAHNEEDVLAASLQALTDATVRARISWSLRTIAPIPLPRSPGRQALRLSNAMIPREEEKVLLFHTWN